MPVFPRLKTGAVSQYPTARSASYATEVVRFLDGSEQRYRVHSAPARRWLIRLDRLDERELAAIEEFFVTMQGQAGSFEFIDPITDLTHAECRFDQDSLESALFGNHEGRVAFSIRQYPE